MQGHVRHGTGQSAGKPFFRRGPLTMTPATRCETVDLR
jgi:hypothetical protein